MKECLWFSLPTLDVFPEWFKKIFFFKKAGFFVTNGDGTADSKYGKTDYNFTTENTIFDGGHWSQRNNNQRFFSQIQIFYPHRPFYADTLNPVANTLPTTCNFSVA